MPLYHYSAFLGHTYYSGTVYSHSVVGTKKEYETIRDAINEDGVPRGFALLNLQVLDDPSRAHRLQNALREAIEYLEQAPFNYANGVVHDGIDEGSVRGMRAHQRLLKRLRKALES